MIKKAHIIVLLLLSLIFGITANFPTNPLPNIVGFTDELIQQIRTNCKVLGIEEDEEYFKDGGCFTWEKTNYSHLYNMLGHFNMQCIITNLVFKSNQNGGITLGCGYYGIAAEEEWEPYNNWLGANIGGHRWNIEDGKYVVRYFFVSGVPSSHKTRIKKMMDRWESAANNKIWFKQVDDDYDDFGKPRFKITKAGSGQGSVSGGVGANVLTTTLKYNNISDLGPLDNHGPTNQIRMQKITTLNPSTGAVMRSTNIIKTPYNDSYSWFNTVILHELGHVLGFHHEQRRADRNNYLVFNCHSGGQNAYNSDFTEYFNTSYDYDSIMHYASKDCNKNDYPKSKWAGHWNFLKKCNSYNSCEGTAPSGNLIPSRVVLGYRDYTYINYDGIIGYQPDSDERIWGIGGIFSPKDKAGVKIAYP